MAAEGGARPEHARPRARPCGGPRARGRAGARPRASGGASRAPRAGRRSEPIRSRLRERTAEGGCAGPPDRSLLRLGAAKTRPIAGIRRALAARPARVVRRSRRRAEPALDVSADRKILGIPAGRAAGGILTTEPGPAECRDPDRGSPDARGSRAHRRRISRLAGSRRDRDGDGTGTGPGHRRRTPRPIAGDQLGVRPMARPVPRRTGRPDPPCCNRLGRFQPRRPAPLARPRHRLRVGEIPLPHPVHVGG